MLRTGSHLIVQLLFKNTVMHTDLLGWHLNNTDGVLFRMSWNWDRTTDSYDFIMYCFFFLSIL